MAAFKKYLLVVFMSLSGAFISSCGSKNNDGSAILSEENLAFEIIKAYSEDGSRREPSLRDYTDVGLLNIIEPKLSLLNKKIRSLVSFQVDTLEELEAIYATINLPPNVVLASTFKVVIPNEITIEAQVTDLDDDSFTYLWRSEDNDTDFVNITTKEFVYTAKTEGIFTFLLEVRDSRGELTSKSFTVNAVKERKLTAYAGEDKEVRQGVAVELVGEASDVEGEITYNWYEDSHIVGGGANYSFKSSKLGLHFLTLEVIDSVGNKALDEIIITVRAAAVIDSVPPIITLKGENPYILSEGEDYNEPGAEATDNIDGDVSGRIVVTGVPIEQATLKEGEAFNIYYNVSDSFGNNAEQKIRIVRVVKSNSDMQAPIITLIGDPVVELTKGQVYKDLGAVAVDNFDKDITSNITVTGLSSILSAEPGEKIKIRYNVSDSAGNKAIEVVRTITIVVDKIKPVITLIGDSTIEVVKGDSYQDLGATAFDNLDGDITNKIKVDGVPSTTNVAVGSQFRVEYNVVDGSGNSADTVIRTIKVVSVKDEIKPVITLIGADVIEIPKGSSYQDLGATAFDNVDGVITHKINVDGLPITTNVAIGTLFKVEYSVVDTAGNSADAVVRTIKVVSADTAPRLILYGMENVNIYQGERYDDYEALAIDNEDGDITWKIKTTGGPVNTDAPPNTVFKISYVVTDSDGNKSVTKDRYIRIIEPGSMDIPAISEGDKETFLGLINKRRLAGMNCDTGEEGVGYPVDALIWDNSLYKAAYEHSQDLGRSDIVPHSNGSGTEHDWSWVRRGRVDGGKSTPVERLDDYSFNGVASQEIPSVREDVTERKIERLFNIPSVCRVLMSSGNTKLGMSVYVQPTSYYRITYVLRLGN